MSNRFPVTIPVQPWFKDHSLGGKIVLAAVETMILLAAIAKKNHPNIDIKVMEDVRFAKFMEIPQQSSSVSALVECEENRDDRLHSKLLSQVKIGKMRRIKEHGEIFFPAIAAPPQPIPEIDQSQPSAPVNEITSQKLYRELVPFGPHYQTLQGKIYLSDRCAWGRLKAPKLPFTSPVQQVLGSPFPLDGAMHTACVMGQQFVDFTPFPVGFRRRIITRPTQPGDAYITKVNLISQTAVEQIFDLSIFDADGEVFETVNELRMRDVGKAIV